MKKIISGILCFVLCITVLVGCESDTQVREDTQQEETEQIDEKETNKAEISFQYIGGTVPDVDDVIDGAISDFEGENSDISVKTIYVDWGNAHSQFMNSVMAGQAPDIAMLAGTWAVEFVENGALADISQYVSEEIIDSFIPSGFDAMVDEDGTKYGLPWDGCTWGVFYRKDILEEAGVEKVPETWDEILEAGEKLKKIDKYVLTVPCAGWEPDDFFLPFMWQAGAEVCERKDGQWVSTMNSPESLEAAKFYYDLTNKYEYMPKSITGMDWEAVKNSFAAGDTAMMIGGMWIIDALKSGNPELDGKWGTGNPISGPEGPAVLSYPNTIHITEQSENKEAAGKFLDFFYSNGYYEDFCIESGVFAFTKDFENSDYAKDEYLAPFIQSAKFGKNRPTTPKYEEFRQMFFCPSIQMLASGEITPEQFCEEMDKAFNEIHQ